MSIGSWNSAIASKQQNIIWTEYDPPLWNCHIISKIVNITSIEYIDTKYCHQIETYLSGEYKTNTQTGEHISINIIEIYVFFPDTCVLSGQWLPCTGCRLYSLSMKWLMCGTLFLHKSTSIGCFWPRTMFPKIRIGQVTWDLLYMRFIYYTKDNQQDCCRIRNWFRNVWGCGLTTCLMCVGPLLGFDFELSVCMKVGYGGEGFFSWFLVVFHVLYITQVLLIIFPLILIYSQIAFFNTKYFVLTFSIDIVSPPSNNIKISLSVMPNLTSNVNKVFSKRGHSFVMRRLFNSYG